jgi:hypothetical protein
VNPGAACCASEEQAASVFIEILVLFMRLDASSFDGS